MSPSRRPSSLRIAVILLVFWAALRSSPSNHPSSSSSFASLAGVLAHFSALSVTMGSPTTCSLLGPSRVNMMPGSCGLFVAGTFMGTGQSKGRDNSFGTGVIGELAGGWVVIS